MLNVLRKANKRFIDLHPSMETYCTPEARGSIVITHMCIYFVITWCVCILVLVCTWYYTCTKMKMKYDERPKSLEGHIPFHSVLLRWSAMIHNPPFPNILLSFLNFQLLFHMRFQCPKFFLPTIALGLIHGFVHAIGLRCEAQYTMGYQLRVATLVFYVSPMKTFEEPILLIWAVERTNIENCMKTWARCK